MLHNLCFAENFIYAFFCWIKEGVIDSGERVSAAKRVHFIQTHNKIRVFATGTISPETPPNTPPSPPSWTLRSKPPPVPFPSSCPVHEHKRVPLADWLEQRCATLSKPLCLFPAYRARAVYAGRTPAFFCQHTQKGQLVDHVEILNEFDKKKSTLD